MESANALDRVLFSSFEHREILQLWTACPEARCGFLWETPEALVLTAAALADLPPALWLHIPLEALQHRPGFWAPFASRLAAWGMPTGRPCRRPSCFSTDRNLEKITLNLVINGKGTVWIDDIVLSKKPLK